MADFSLRRNGRHAHLRCLAGGSSTCRRVWHCTPLACGESSVLVSCVTPRLKGASNVLVGSNNDEPRGCSEATRVRVHARAVVRRTAHGQHGSAYSILCFVSFDVAGGSWHGTHVLWGSRPRCASVVRTLATLLYLVE